MKRRYKILSVILALILAIGSIVTISVVSSSAESFTDENGIEWEVTENYPGWAIKPKNIANINGDVIIPESYNDKLITNIDAKAFNSCTGLTSIKIPESIGYISNYAFEGCTSLTSIEIPNSVTIIGAGAFEGCTNLTSLDLGNGVKTIGNSTFRDCTGLTSIEIPNSVTSIDAGAFRGCTGLTSIEIPNSVTIIGAGAFNGCTSLTSIEIPNNVTSIGNNAFYNCTGLTSIEIPDSVTKIDYNAFNNCTGLTSVKIPDSVTKIDYNAFRYCTGLTSIKIPDSVTYIGNRAFDGCTNLTNVDFNPKNVEYIGTKAFPSKFAISSTPASTNYTFTDENGIEWEVTENYPGWAIKPKNIANINGDVIIPESYNDKLITNIDERAFTACTGLTSIEIPNSVTSIGDSAFSGCTGLTSIEIPDSVTKIDYHAFYNCTGLTSIEIPNSVTIIGAGTFASCNNLKSAKLPADITVLPESIFNTCSQLNFTIPDSVTHIGDYAFNNCKGLTSITIPDSVTYIGNHAFDGCSSALSINELPTNITYIGDSAFNNCNQAFDSIVIPENAEYVGSYAFGNLGKLDTLTIKNSRLSDISILAFYNDTFKNFVVTDTVEEIDSVILSGNKNFSNVMLGSNIQSIKPNAFFGNTNMTITAPENADVVIDYANKNNIPITVTSAVDITRTVDFEVTCDKTGYEFTVYRVADLEAGSSPFFIRYDSLLSEIEDEIFEGDSEAMLAELDKVDESALTEVVGTYSTDVDGASKVFEDLPAGIYYVRATNFPANVYSVQNSVFALPYYKEDTNWWTYELSPIPLATKVDESDPEIVKTITNSTQDNVNFTDVSLGDTVNFEIEASRVGSANEVASKDFKLNSYVVSDIMEAGLTLNADSFVVTLEDIDGNTLATLEDTTDYIVAITAEEGKDTTFTVSLTDTYLQDTEFYSSANIVIAYSAVLNEYSTREFDGNYNTATDLTWTNKTDVQATVEGNTVYVYTFGIEVNKYDDAGTPLAGSVFDLYLTNDDAKAQTNSIATGTSDDNGNVVFYTADGDVAKLQSGEYFIIETKSTDGYNRYTDVIPVTISVEYGETEVNGTYIESAPENGVQLVEVKNSKVVIPNTGGDGAMYRYLIAALALMLAITFVALKKRNSKKATATK